jgi:hypothetical protein
MERNLDPIGTVNIPVLDRPLTLKAAAKSLDVPYFKIQRAVRRGLIPTDVGADDLLFLTPAKQ